ncbi:MAG: ABC transporter permease, partial [Alphaproteobacteria bacterium]|nr:ABC transporter permease [Alphaproteobacteria bacterium]
MLRLAPPATLLVFLAPIVAGLLGTALPAFGWFPALGAHAFGLDVFARLFAQPGLGTSVALTLFTGFLATALSLTLALAFCAAAYGTNAFGTAQRFLAPLLATPHAALAIGFAFLIAPSGWIARLISPELTGWTRPPDIATVQDPLGLAFVAGLMLKETPYLLLCLVAAIGQADLARSLTTARMLGYGKFTAWAKIAIPRLYRQIRLPVYAVLAFALSNVDVALILAPTNPPTLSVLIVRWFSDPHLDLFLPAMAAGLLQFALVVAAIGAWRLGEIVIANSTRDWLTNGERGGEGRLRNASRAFALTLLFALAIAALIALAIWSIALSWRFPDALPDRWTSANWLREAPALAAPATTTLLVALSATAIAIMLSVLCLENEIRTGMCPTKALVLLYAPLLIPQTSFLIGAQTLLVRLNLDGGFAALVWAHLLIVLP